jgi:hypothetical protein
MKAFGGCGYGVFESSQDLVGYESLCLMQYLDPELYTDLFNKIGDLYATLWTKMVKEYSDIFVFFRMGDDLGHKTSTMLEPDTIRQFILPQYKRIIDIVHAGNKKFLLHSCGKIFELMPDIIALGIDAKHSNEDQIAPYQDWINLYGDKIGLFGGFDMNELILNKYDYVFDKVKREAALFRSMTQGYGAGSGNSIPDYMAIDGFQAMVDAVFAIRQDEGKFDKQSSSGSVCIFCNGTGRLGWYCYQLCKTGFWAERHLSKPTSIFIVSVVWCVVGACRYAHDKTGAKKYGIDKHPDFVDWLISFLFQSTIRNHVDSLCTHRNWQYNYSGIAKSACDKCGE